MRPIVILERRDGSSISAQVAPGNNTLGVMLPYAPVHVLLLEGDPFTMVATSANLSDQPLVSDNQEAREKLSQIADAYLFHNREIHTGCDDSIFRLIAGQPVPIRRARGYAPSPIQLPFESPSIMACGGELKNTFCLTREDNAFLSQHIGDLKNAETYQFYLSMIQRFQHLFRVRPTLLAHDLHPQYLSSRFARQLSEKAENGLKRIAVQHHHAHVAACMAENGMVEPVIGVVFDGLGYGADGHIWGAEFMVADYAGYRRLGQLRYVPLPGADAANRQPWRMALSYLYSLYGPELGTWERSLFSHMDARLLEGVVQMLVRDYNAPLASSMGRLFDAVSSLLGLCQHNTFEGEAAVSLQVAAEEVCETLPGYSWSISRKGDYLTIDPNPLFSELLQDLRRRMSIPEIAHRFHQSVAELVSLVCRHIREVSGLSRVALSGGVFQNKLLTELTVDLLHRDGFEPLLHKRVPPNDGGIALGQAAIVGYQKSNP
jgi:hydrogenase maturation protein HypF